MSDELLLSCRCNLFEVKKKQEGKDVPYSMVFTFFDDRKSSPHIDTRIQYGGGVVLPYEKREEDPYTITLIDPLYFEENPDQNPLLPNDIYAVNFIYDFLKADGANVNLNDYLFEEIAFKKYDAMEVLNRQNSWADLIPLADPPTLQTWKQLMAPSPEVVVAPAVVRAPPVAKDIPVVRALPVVKDIPVVRAPPVVKDIPVVRAPPVVKDIPVARAPPVVKDIPVVKAPPVVKDIPVVRAPPVVKDIPVVRAPLVVKDIPVVRAPLVVVALPPAEGSSKKVPAPLPVKRLVKMDTQLVLGGPKPNYGKRQRPPAPAPGTWIELATPVAESSVVGTAAYDFLHDVYDIINDSDEEGRPQPKILKTVTTVKTAAAVKNSKPKMRGKNYSLFHSQKILDLILEKGWMDCVGGNMIWQLIEGDKLLVKEIGKRPWASLRTHFKKVIEVDLTNPLGPEKLRISPENLEKFNNSVKKRNYQVVRM